MSVDVARLSSSLTRLGNVHQTITGRTIDVKPANTSAEALVASLERVTASLTGASDLPSILLRVEAVLGALGLPSSSTTSQAADLAAIVNRVEVLTANLPGLPPAPVHSYTPEKPTHAPVATPAPSASTTTTTSSSSAAHTSSKPSTTTASHTAPTSTPTPAPSTSVSKPATAVASTSTPATTSTASTAPKVASTTPSTSVTPSKPVSVTSTTSSSSSAASKPATTSSSTSTPAASSSSPSPSAVVTGGKFYSIEELKKPAGSIAGVDYKNREQYLSDSDFQNLFKMSKADFNKLAGWKKETEKKKHGLF